MMVYKRPKIKQRQYNKIIPIDSSNPDEVAYHDSLIASHEAYMKECDEIDAYWKNHPVSKIGTEVKAVYNNAKKKVKQFEKANPRIATGLKIGACIAGAALLIGAVKNLADVIDDDDSGSHDYLNVAADSEDEIMQSRGDGDVEYDIENISNDTANRDIQPAMDEHGVYWLKGDGPHDIMYRDNDGNVETLTEDVSMYYHDIIVDDGNIIYTDSQQIYLINKDDKQIKVVVDEPSSGYKLSPLAITDNKLIYSVRNLEAEESSLYMKYLDDGTILKIDDNSGVRGFNENYVPYSKTLEDGTSQGRLYNIQTKEITNLTTLEHMRDIHIKDGRVVFVGSNDGENWAVYLIEDINNLDSFEKIKDIEYDGANIALSNEKCVIDDFTNKYIILDLQTKEKIDFSKQGRGEFYSFEDKILYKETEDTAINPDSEVYITDLSVKQPDPIEPINNPPLIKTEKGEINGKGIEVLVEDPEGDDVTLTSLDSDYGFKGNELVYNSEIPEDNLTELVKVKATDSKGAYTEKDLEVTVVGTGKEEPDPNPHNPNPENPNPDENQSVPNTNDTSSGGGFWSEYMIPIIGATVATVTTATAAVLGVVGYKRHKKKKGKQNGRKPTAFYPKNSQQRKEVPAYSTPHNVQNN